MTTPTQQLLRGRVYVCVSWQSDTNNPLAHLHVTPGYTNYAWESVLGLQTLEIGAVYP